MFPGELIPLAVPEVRRLLCRLLWLPRGSPTPDRPLVWMETAASGPGHAVSLRETPSETFTTSVTVILSLRIRAVLYYHPIRSLLFHLESVAYPLDCYAL